MARKVLIISTIVFLGVLTGCSGVDSGRGQLVSSRSKGKTIVNVAATTETDIVEQVAVNRQAYHKGLEELAEYYRKTGNSMKLDWARKELGALDATPQYNYIIEAGVAGPELKASESIPAADELYSQAVAMEEKAGALVVVKDDNLLRKALEKYNLLIRKYPSSDKIGDAAYRAAGIYVHFKDYTIAMLYLQRTYEWDPETPYPARFEVAYIFDEYLHRRAEALDAYQQAMKALRNEYEFPVWRQYAEKRIAELSGSNQKIE
jgi:tetratricopeptide (TPR) repeat protein